MNKIFTIVSVLLIVTVWNINVNPCANGGVSISFQDTQGYTDSTTRANLCHDGKFLYAKWENVDK